MRSEIRFVPVFALICLAAWGCAGAPEKSAPTPVAVPIVTSAVAGRPLEGMGGAAPVQPANAVASPLALEVSWEQWASPLPVAESDPVGAEVSFWQDPDGEILG